MNYMKRLGGTIILLASLGGCGGNDFNGTYGTDGPYGKNVALSISGDNAKMFIISKSTNEISNVTAFTVTSKSEKLLLDSTDGDTRLVFKRGIDERGLDCANCKSLHVSEKWAFINPEPFDVDSTLKEQEKKKKAEQEEAQKLAKFNGDWVLKRDSKIVGLIIFSISSRNGAKWRAFNYSSAAKLIDVDRPIKVEGEKLTIFSQDGAANYMLSDDGKQLRCIDCKPERYFVKADPMKISDLNYTRDLAGDPQE